MNMDPKLARKLTQRRKRGIQLLFDDCGKQLLALCGENVGHLGRENIVGTRRFRFTDKTNGGIDIRAGIKTRAHLDHRRLECAGAHGAALPPASNGSSLPSRSSACSSSLPPTWTVPMKICGTVMRPFALRTISSRRSQSRLTSISL